MGVRQLRESDEFKELFTTFSNAVEAMRQRETEEGRKLQQAIESLATLAITPEQLSAVEILRGLQSEKGRVG